MTIPVLKFIGLELIVISLVSLLPPTFIASLRFCFASPVSPLARGLVQAPWAVCIPSDVMGLVHSLLSEPPPPPPSLPPVKTYDQFVDRFHNILRDEGLNRREEEWLSIIFRKFGTLSQSGETLWNVNDLIGFMALTLPEALQPDLEATAPLIHRLVLNLGHFPWSHDDPSSCRFLGFRQASAATIILLRRHERTRIFYHEHLEIYVDENMTDTDFDRWFHRLLFQSMAKGRSIPTKPKGLFASERSHSNHSSDDDQYLMGAHKFVTDRNNDRDWKHYPGVLFTGDPIIPISSLPTARSQDVDGGIPAQEFRPLLKILLASILHLCGGRSADALCVDIGKLDKLTEIILSTFGVTSAGPEVIDYVAYQSALHYFVPSLFAAIPRLFAPFIYDQGLDHQVSKDSSRTESGAMIREALTYKLDKIGFLAGEALDPFVLAQLATFLPFSYPSGFPLFSAERLDPWSFTSDQFSRLTMLHDRTLLIVEGYYDNHQLIDVPVDEDSTPICFGVLVNPGRTQSSWIFQFAPRHLVWKAPSRFMHFTGSDGKTNLTIQLPSKEQDSENSSRRGNFSLAMDDERNDTWVSKFSIPSPDETTVIESGELRIHSVEMMGFIERVENYDFMTEEEWEEAHDYLGVEEEEHPLDSTFLVMGEPNWAQ